jgi:hypothetical protein
MISEVKNQMHFADPLLDIRDYLFLKKSTYNLTKNLNLMAFDGKEGATITLQQGAAFTATYREAYPNEVKAHYVGKNLIASIAQQTGVVGIRFYHGIDENGARTLVMVGVNSSGNDVTSGIIGDRMINCPTVCDANGSSLNG